MTSLHSATRRVPRSLPQKVLDRAYGALRKLPPATTDYGIEHGMLVPMRDGVRLLADLYTPTGPSRGILLVRSPYGRAAPHSNEFARIYAERGFTVLMQSCRGTSGSEGVKTPFQGEIDDGADTVAWLREQPWFTGRFATLGLSYLGYNEWALLMDPPPELVAAVMSSAPHNFGRIVAEGRVLALEMALGFSDMMAHQEDDGLVGSVRRARSAIRRHAPVIESLPLAGAEAELLGDAAPWYREWLAHPDPRDAYWAPGDFDAALERASIPVLLQGGWQDLFLEQTLEQYGALRARGVPVAVTIGPWTHVDAAGSASSRLSNESLDWLSQHLAGDAPVERRLDAPVRLHVGGADEWRDLPDWPPPAQPATLLLGAGAAGGNTGTLGGNAGAPGSRTSFCYDPQHPTPNVGGATQVNNPGVKDNTALEARDDVVTFTGPVLEADLEVIGVPVVRLFHETDNPFVDLMVRLCEVDASGRSSNLAETYQRLDTVASTGELVLPLRPLAHRFVAGTRLRLQVSGGAFPRYMRNLGTPDAPGEGTELVPSHRTIWHDEARPSSVSLPVVLS